MIEITSISEALPHLLKMRVVLFDMDDTLYPEKQYVKSGYNKIASHNPEITDMSQKLWQVFLRGGKAIDEVLQSEGVYSAEKARECIEIYRNQMPDITLYDGVEDILNTLLQNGIRLGMITDGRPEGQWAKINALGIEKYFDKIIVTDELGGVEYRKPNPMAFQLMQNHFGVSFDEMVYVGDNPTKDFIAPEKLGMKTIYFKNKDGLYSR